MCLSVNPKDLIRIIRNGTDDIAETFYPSDEVGMYCLSGLKIYYTAGSTSATITLSMDHHRGTNFDFELWQITGAGGGGSNVNLGIASDELKEWAFCVYGCDPSERDGLLIAQTLGSSDDWSIQAEFISAKTIR